MNPHCGPAVQPGHAKFHDHVPDRPRPDPEHDPASGQRGQRRDRAGQHRCGTGGQAGNRNRTRDLPGPPQEK